FISGLLIDAVGVRAAFAAMALSACAALYLVLRHTRGMPRPQVPETAPRDAAAALAPDEVAEPDVRAPHIFDLLATPEMRRIYWVNALTAASWDLFIAMLPVLGHRLGYSASVIGTVYSCFAVGTFAARAVMPWLSRRFTEWEIMRASMVVITLVYLAFPFLTI